jgi:hypothetical protein
MYGRSRSRAGGSDARRLRSARRVVPTARAGSETSIFLGDEDVTGELRAPAVEANVSKYSAIPGVRSAMVGRQREVAQSAPAVLAGRDIGTVVLPDAPLKIFLTASEEARAARRGERSRTPPRRGTFGPGRPTAAMALRAPPTRRARYHDDAAGCGARFVRERVAGLRPARPCPPPSASAADASARHGENRAPVHSCRCAVSALSATDVSHGVHWACTYCCGSS